MTSPRLDQSRGGFELRKDLSTCPMGTGLPFNSAKETMKTGFEGKEGSEVISGRKGDIVQAVLPEYRDGRQVGVIIVESLIPAEITENVENIKDAYENYLAFESWKAPIKANYLIILGFLTLIVIFMALWIGLRISKGITDPIQSLAQATELVASGNLDVTVDIERGDEIGLLVRSFNHMVQELKDGKESLQSAYLESDRRRLFMENILDHINSGVIMPAMDRPTKMKPPNRAITARITWFCEDQIKASRHARAKAARSVGASVSASAVRFW